jgi:hypothetical protein
MKKAEEDQLLKTTLRKEAVIAQEQGLSKDSWKNKKMKDINDGVTK